MSRKTMPVLTRDLPRSIEEYIEVFRRLPELMRRIQESGHQG